MSVAVKAHLFFDRCPKILDQMKPISHLPSLRSTLSGGLSIQAAAISADDLDSRAFLQPCFCALNAAVVQNIDNRSSLEIDNDSAVTRGVPPAPIINATTGILSACLLARASRFNCRKIVSSLTGMPSRCIEHSPGRPPMLWPIKRRPHPSLLFGAYRVKQSWATGLRRFAAGISAVTLPSIHVIIFHDLALNWQVLEAAVVPAMPVTASRSTIPATPIGFAAAETTQFPSS